MIDRPRKVAICGTAPSSLDEAPWQDPEVEIWGTSRLYKMIPDEVWTVWFELHDLPKIGKGWSCGEDQRKEQRDEHLEYLASQTRPVYVQPQYEDAFPAAVGYPLEEVFEEFPSRYFTNHISWMIALAIYQDVDEIGIYGVDMALQGGEYEYQRPSVEYFIGIARGRGIPVEVPDSCDLLKTTRLYGVDDGQSPFDKKVRAREDELNDRINQVEDQIEQLQAQDAQLAGAVNAYAELAQNGVPEDLREKLKESAQQMQQQREQVQQQILDGQIALAKSEGAKENTDYLKRAWMS